MNKKQQQKKKKKKKNLPHPTPQKQQQQQQKHTVETTSNKQTSKETNKPLPLPPSSPQSSDSYMTRLLINVEVTQRQRAAAAPLFCREGWLNEVVLLSEVWMCTLVLSVVWLRVTEL